MDDDSGRVAVTFRLELSDVIAARRTLLWRTKTGRLLLPLLAVVLLAQAIATGAVVGLVAGVVGIAVAAVLILYVQPRRALRTNASLRGEQHWTLDAEHIAVAVAGPDGDRISATEIAWRSVREVRETGNAFLFAWSAVMFMTLPKRALDDGQADAVRRLVAAHALAGEDVAPVR